MSRTPTRRAVRKVLDELEVPERYKPKPKVPISPYVLGRTSSYSKAIADVICERLAMGESLRTICNDEGYPNRKTVVNWKNNNEEFRKAYASARQDQADSYAELGLEVATTAEDAIKGRLAFDAYRWAAGKLKPGTYGDKVQHTGANDAPLFPIVTLRFGDDK